MIEKEDTLEKAHASSVCDCYSVCMFVMRVAEKSEKAGSHTTKAVFATTAEESEEPGFLYI